LRKDDENDFRGTGRRVEPAIMSKNAGKATANLNADMNKEKTIKDKELDNLVKKFEKQDPNIKNIFTNSESLYSKENSRQKTLDNYDGVNSGDRIQKDRIKSRTNQESFLSNTISDDKRKSEHFKTNHGDDYDDDDDDDGIVIAGKKEFKY
jgi:hypothetical protein